MVSKDIKLVKGMTKNEVNELISDYLLIDDRIYNGSKHKHNWKCKCGNVFNKSWRDIKNIEIVKCEECKYKETERRYRTKVEETNEYEYIRSYRKYDILPDGRMVNGSPYIQVKHKYCGSVYEVQTNGFINIGSRCNNCCHKYENSFAYHIEVELGESLEKYWDFEKNTVNPYHISRASANKVWIKCQNTDYHGSYEISCDKFVIGRRCSYCNRFASQGKKIHPKDSFGQYLKENDLLHLWSDKNKVDPFKISKYHNDNIWMLCDKHDYHNDYGGYEIRCTNFIKVNARCSYCNPSGKTPKIHPLDSFGYHHFNRVLSWHPDNNISPFRVALNSNKKYKFICETCNHMWYVSPNSISRGTWCPRCKSSKGERKISEWLRRNNIKYNPQKEFDGLLGVNRGFLKFDFYLPEHNLLIEYDGLQHDKWIKSWMSKEYFEKLQYHDKLKNEYAENNNIKLIRIKEKDFDNIEGVLKSLIRKTK